MLPLEGLGEQRLARFNRLAAQIPTIQFQQIDRTRTALASAPWRRIKSNTVRPFASQTIASPSIRHDRTGSLPTAMAMNGKRDEKSFPARVIRRTPVASLRAKMRKPSCLISWIQPGPLGGALAGDGSHGSTIPRPGRVRSRNDIDHLIGAAV